MLGQDTSHPRSARPFALCAALLWAGAGSAHAQTAVSNLQLCTLAGPPNGQARDGSGYINDSPAPDPNTLASAFSGVGSVHSPGNGGTGVALDRRHILTAAHLLTSGGTVFAPSQVQFDLNVGNTTFDQPITASAIAVDPLYFQPNNKNDSGDIGIITLSQDLPASVQTYSLYTGPVNAATPLTFVGYGQSGNGAAGYDPRTQPGAAGNSFTTKRAVQNVPDGAVDANGNIVDPFSGEQVFAIDFDGPDSTPVSQGGTTNYLGGGSLGNDIEGMIGNGDSGGPAFIQTAGGRYEVAGDISFMFQLQTTGANGQTVNGPGVGLFGSGGGGQVISAYTDFIDPILAPEPGSVVTLGVGAALLIAAVRRRHQR